MESLFQEYNLQCWNDVVKHKGYNMKMKKKWKVFVLLLIVGISFGFINFKNVEDHNSKNVSEQIRSHVKKYEKENDYQGTVLVAQPGTILFKEAFGLADRKEKIENTLSTPFLIGSLTKSFVAVTVMQLVEEKVLDLNAPLKLYIPDLKDDLAKDLTLHILLKHQSGLVPHLERIIDFEDKDVNSQEIIEIINSSSLSFSPTSQYQYSNLNYTLSAIAIENATGKSLAQVLQEKTFQPLGMHNSGVERKTNYPQHRAKGYRKTAFGIKNEENIISYALGSGDIFSTIEDLYLWDQALYGNDLLSNKSKALVFEGENSEFGNYGYGFRIQKYQRGITHKKNGTLVRHGGTMNGFMANLHRYLDDELTVIILGNIRTFPIRNMTFELKEIALGVKVNTRNRSDLE